MRVVPILDNAVRERQPLRVSCRCRNAPDSRCSTKRSAVPQILSAAQAYAQSQGNDACDAPSVASC
jgi:hypothetical protein